MTDPPRIFVDHGRCVGNAMCLSLARGVFSHNAHRQSEVVDASAADLAAILNAAAHCPVEAIRVEDARTGERLYGS